MRLVDEHQRVGGQVIEQGRRRLTRLAPREVARIVFDALAETQLVKHLEIEAGALLDALRLDQPAFTVEELDAQAQFLLDRLDRAQHGGARRHVVRRREHGEARQLVLQVAGQRVEQLQRLDLVVEQRDADRVLGVLGRKDVDHVAAHAEGAAMKVDLVALVLHLGQALDHVALPHAVADAHGENHLVVFVAVADAVDARNGGDDHHIAALEQTLGRRQAHLLDVVVDRRILLDEQVARRHVGFRLVVVVVGDEVLDRVLRKEFAEFGVELRRQRLVRREHERRATGAGDDVGHRVGLARAGHAEQGLEGQAVLDAFDQLGDRRRLIAGRRERLMQPERTPLESDERRFFGGLRGTRHDRILGCFKTGRRRQACSVKDDRTMDKFSLFRNSRQQARRFDWQTLECP